MSPLNFVLSPKSLSKLVPYLAPPLQDTPKNPCQPSPCGPYSQCRTDSNNLAICSCQPNYLGSPPYCKPECTINADCSNDLACENQKCKNPCLGACGYSAQCRVFNHNANCFCPDGMTGDPFTSCSPAPPPRMSYSDFVLIFPFYAMTIF